MIFVVSVSQRVFLPDFIEASARSAKDPAGT